MTRDGLGEKLLNYGDEIKNNLTIYCSNRDDY